MRVLGRTGTYDLRNTIMSSKSHCAPVLLLYTLPIRRAHVHAIEIARLYCCFEIVPAFWNMQKFKMLPGISLMDVDCVCQMELAGDFRIFRLSEI